MASYGASAHLWLPGVGRVNGIAVGNFLDSAGVTPAVLSDPIGRVNNCSKGAVVCTQSTAQFKPFLRQRSGNFWAWEFDGVDDNLAGSTPVFSSPTSLGISVVAAKSSGGAGSRFAVSNRDSSSAAGANCCMFTDGKPTAFWYSVDGFISLLLTHPTATTGAVAVVSAHAIGNTNRTLRVNGAVSQTNTTALNAGAINNMHIGASLRNGTPIAAFFDGDIYGIACVSGSVTATDALIIERGLAVISGAAI